MQLYNIKHQTKEKKNCNFSFECNQTYPFSFCIYCHCFLYKHPQEIGLHHLKTHNNRCTALFLGFVASPFLINWVNLEALPIFKTNVISANCREAIFFIFCQKSFKYSCQVAQLCSARKLQNIIVQCTQDNTLIENHYTDLRKHQYARAGIHKIGVSIFKGNQKSIYVLHNKIITMDIFQASLLIGDSNQNVPEKNQQV